MTFALLLWLSVGPCEPPVRWRVRVVNHELIVDWVQF